MSKYGRLTVYRREGERYLLPAQLLNGALFPEMEESPGSLLPAHELKAWGFRFSILAAAKH